MRDFEVVGKIQKTFGVNGELLVVCYTDEEIVAGRPLFIEIEGLWVPFFVQKAERKGQKILLVFEDVENEKLSKTLVGKDVFVEEKKKTSAAKKTETTWDDLTGYDIHDEKMGRVGKIDQWFDFSGNLCFQVETPHGEKKLIPAHPDLIVHMDKKTKILQMNLPAGLFNNE